MSAVFTDIYKRNHWKGNKSRSGSGSDSDQTAEVKLILTQVLKDFDVTTLLDIPCGDLYWMKDIEMANISYCGADIVKELIEYNIAVNRKINRRFLHADINTSQLPNVDLIFCRDCLVHFSNKDIETARENIKRSGSKYLLTTTFPAHINSNIVTGNWRPVNLQAKPFSFPPPVKVFNEKCTEDIRYKDKSLALWRISDL
jgi:SAM-dependent methyltransferase